MCPLGTAGLFSFALLFVIHDTIWRRYMDLWIDASLRWIAPVGSNCFVRIKRLFFGISMTYFVCIIEHVPSGCLFFFYSFVGSGYC